MNGYLFTLKLPLTSVLSRTDTIDMNGINSYGYSYLFTAGISLGDDKSFRFLSLVHLMLATYH